MCPTVGCSTTQLTTEAGTCVLHKVLHDERQAGEARGPDELVHGGLRGKGTRCSGRAQPGRRCPPRGGEHSTAPRLNPRGPSGCGFPGVTHPPPASRHMGGQRELSPAASGRPGGGTEPRGLWGGGRATGALRSRPGSSPVRSSLDLDLGPDQLSAASSSQASVLATRTRPPRSAQDLPGRPLPPVNAEPPPGALAPGQAQSRLNPSPFLPTPTASKAKRGCEGRARQGLSSPTA